MKYLDDAKSEKHAWMFLIVLSHDGSLYYFMMLMLSWGGRNDMR
jgi:hypothetical protein